MKKPLRIKELEQVTVGNLLMDFAIQCRLDLLGALVSWNTHKNQMSPTNQQYGDNRSCVHCFGYLVSEHSDFRKDYSERR